tara:strand:+ start:27 stop:464 length:438 start_codon:yes stop_codon:yes gene_type:complete
MDKYGDVKIGDEFFYRRKVGINKWRAIHFGRDFYLSCKVVRVTKSQFSTELGRYRKNDGCSIGGAPSIHKAGDCHRWLGLLVVIPSECQSSAAESYKREIQPLMDARNVDLRRIEVTNFKNIETAKSAASLILQLDALVMAEAEK